MKPDDELPSIASPHQKYKEWKENEITQFFFKYLEAVEHEAMEDLVNLSLSTNIDVNACYRRSGLLALVERLLNDSLLEEIERSNTFHEEDELTKPEETSYGKTKH